MAQSSKKSSKRAALITGVTGQDGAYLAKFLLSKGYRVVGCVRRTSAKSTARLEELGVAQDVEYVDLDLFEYNNVLRVIDKVQPDEVFNLAAQSFVGLSFEQPLYTAEIDALGVTRLLEAIKTVNKDIRFYQASTSELYGKVVQTPQNEETPFHPRSPYAVAKLYAHWNVVNYRESYGMHLSSGILFNHESPLRGLDFVTRKITHGLASVKHGKTKTLQLGNIDARRDWGFAKEYVEGMWKMIQQDKPGDYVLATGATTSVRDFIGFAAEGLEFKLEWKGKGVKERGVDTRTGKTVVEINPDFYRPAEVELLLGDPAKAKKKLGWTAQTDIKQLAIMMVEADNKRVRDDNVRF
jgi:GDPmannose 4,6-dehydratase